MVGWDFGQDRFFHYLYSWCHSRFSPLFRCPHITALLAWEFFVIDSPDNLLWIWVHDEEVRVRLIRTLNPLDFIVEGERVHVLFKLLFVEGLEAAKAAVEGDFTGVAVRLQDVEDQRGLFLHVTAGNTSIHVTPLRERILSLKRT